MNKEDLFEKLAFLNDGSDAIGVELYFVQRIHNASSNSKTTEILRADLDNEDLQEKIRRLFLKGIKSKILANSDLKMLPIMQANSDLKNVLYHVPRDQGLHADLQQFISFSSTSTTFEFSNHRLSDLIGFVVILGNESKRISLFKLHYHMQLMSRGKVLKVWQSDTRFEAIESDMLSITEKFEFLNVDGQLYTTSISALEDHFGYDAVVRKRAEDVIKIIEEKGIVSKVELLMDQIADRPFARKMMNLTNSPVLDISREAIRLFVETKHEKAKGRFKFDVDNRIVLSSKESTKRFLTLLSDGYLKSDLTNREIELHNIPIELSNSSEEVD